MGARQGLVRNVWVYGRDWYITCGCMAGIGTQRVGARQGLVRNVWVCGRDWVNNTIRSKAKAIQPKVMFLALI